MHQNFTLFGILRRVVAHPRIYRQREKSPIDIHLERLNQRKLLFITITFKKIKIVIPFFFACDISLASHFFQNVFNVSRRHQAVAEAGVEGDLLRLHLNIRAFMKTETLEWNRPPFGLLNKLIPNYVIFTLAGFGVFLNIISTKFKISGRSTAFAEIKGEYFVILADKGWYNTLLFGRRGCQSNDSTELIFL